MIKRTTSHNQPERPQVVAETFMPNECRNGRCPLKSAYIILHPLSKSTTNQATFEAVLASGLAAGVAMNRGSIRPRPFGSLEHLGTLFGLWRDMVIHDATYDLFWRIANSTNLSVLSKRSLLVIRGRRA